MIDLSFFKNLPENGLEALAYYLDFLGAKTNKDVFRLAGKSQRYCLGFSNKKKFCAETAIRYIQRIEEQAVSRGCHYHEDAPGSWKTHGEDLLDVLQLCCVDERKLVKLFGRKTDSVKKILRGEDTVLQSKTMRRLCRLTNSYPEEIATKYICKDVKRGIKT